MKERKMKAVIFDMDGTLTDTEKLYADTWLELAVRYGQEPNLPFTRAVCGTNGQEMIDVIAKYYPAIDAKSFMDDCFATVAAKVEKQVPLKEGAEELVAYFKEGGYKLAVASSNVHAQIEKNMINCGLHSYFDVYMGGDEVKYGKPNPDIFIAAAQKMGVKPEECYVFEDGMNGLRAALAANCKTIMMVDLTEPDDLVAPQCAAIYYSFLEALEELRNENV